MCGGGPLFKYLAIQCKYIPHDVMMGLNVATHTALDQTHKCTYIYFLYYFSFTLLDFILHQLHQFIFLVSADLYGNKLKPTESTFISVVSVIFYVSTVTP